MGSGSVVALSYCDLVPFDFLVQLGFGTWQFSSSMNGSVAAIPWGSWDPDSLTFCQRGGPNVDRPALLAPWSCCYTWPAIHSISSVDSGWTLYARWFL